MIKFQSEFLKHMYGDTPLQYDIAFLHYAIRIRYKNSEEYKLLESDFDYLKQEVNDNQFKIYFYSIDDFLEIKNKTNIFSKYSKYIYVRINNEDDLIRLSKEIDNNKINVIIDYNRYNNFVLNNINIILQVDKISSLSSKKLLELNNKYNINNIYLGQAICFSKEYCYELIKEYNNGNLLENDNENRDFVLKLFLSNDIYSISEYKKIEEELYKLINNSDAPYQRFYNMFKNIVIKATYNWKGLEEEVNENQNLIGVLLKNKGVCESFCKVLYQLCSLANIECIIVCGGSSKEQGGHMWNQVCINGICYNADCAVDSNLYREKGKLYLCLVSDDNVLYKANSLLACDCSYNYDFITKSNIFDNNKSNEK